ncbi:hypothetical protein BXT84_14830 [Sulfobacillus thermotolerans]|uniref:Glycosyl transferase family 1 n=1 Tax=Sulfobacillus thermotolerans TaxID=338644 RepID=A0ABM6RUA8_9FIRM|nr:hypothetical protein BXT84_14830 [Sulfobacillus thermotolerans]
MRVLMISKACVSASYRTKLEYLNQLDNQVEVGLVVPPAWGSLTFEPRPQDHSYPLFIAPIRLNGRNHFHYYPELLSIIRRFQPDLLHIDEEPYSSVTYQAVRIAKRLDIPSVFFAWQNIYKNYPWPFSLMERTVFQTARGAIVGNQEAQDVIRRKGFDKPVWIIPQFGCDVGLYQPHDPETAKRIWNLDGQFVISYMGRLIEEKGLDDLWMAAAPLLAQHPHMTLLFVGSGPWQATGQKLAHEAHLDNQVRFVPWVSTGDMPQILNGVDVLVLPSRTTARWKEQFGRILTEAMATEVPVIGSSSGEIPQVIGDAGLVVPEQSPTALAEALQTIFVDEDLRRSLGKKGRLRVLNHFSQEVIATNTMAAYHQLLS